MITTFEKQLKDKTNFYVFQLISSKEMADYLADHFKR
jgi:hypothetical protein